MSNANITAVVLAGGRGQRMSGQDKGLLLLQGVPLLEHVLKKLRCQVRHILINANRNWDAYEQFGCPLISDEIPDFPGPLAGIVSAMRAAETSYVLAVPCDSPFLAPDLTKLLYQKLQEKQQMLSVAHDGQRLQPVFALLDCRLRDSLLRYLNSGGRKIAPWFEERNAVQVDFSHRPEMFRNVNTPAELEALARELDKETLPDSSEQRATPEISTVAAPGAEPAPTRHFAEDSIGLNPGLLTIEQALSNICRAIRPVAEVETLGLHEALNRVLADDLHSALDIPMATNSAMDGYALNAADLPSDGDRTLFLVGSAHAGHPYLGPVHSGACVSITTGAVMPDHTDTVVIQEQAEVLDKTVRIRSGTPPGANVRQAGEDIARNELVLSGGTRLTPAGIGLLASLGIDKVSVKRAVRVAFFSTGDELCSLGNTAKPGQVYDSNRYTLYGMLQGSGRIPLDLVGVIRDEPEQLEQALQQAASQADVVITSGGASVGSADLIRQCLQKVGQMHFWKVAIKPGRPLVFGSIGDAWFFGLPGNPVSVMVTFDQLVDPALRHLEGEQPQSALQFEVPCLSHLHKRPGRIEYQRGILKRDFKQGWVVRKCKNQGSGVLSSMTQANCYIVLPLEAIEVKPGALVSVQPFRILD